MIEAKPFINPFKKTEKIGGKVVEVIKKNGKEYKKVVVQNGNAKN